MISITCSADFGRMSHTAIVAEKHIPAWKRLGLKLKSQLPTDNSIQFDNKNQLKRKRSSLEKDSVVSNKIKKTEKRTIEPVIREPSTPTSTQGKLVKFTPDTKIDDGDSIKRLYNSWAADQKPHSAIFNPKSSKGKQNSSQVSDPSKNNDINLEETGKNSKGSKRPKGKKNTSSPLNVLKPSKSSTSDTTETSKIPPFLSYLEQYHNNRETWKFKKNHQSQLLQHIFDPKFVPSDHIHLVYDYIKGLQGLVRTRLRDTALAIKVQDQENGLAEFTTELQKQENVQEEYDMAIKDYIANSSALVVRQLGYEEELVMKFTEKEIKDRFIKRTRAEMIINELASSPDTARSVCDTPIELSKEASSSGVLQKNARKRKQRTVVDESSSESSSSDSSSEDSSSEESSAEDSS
ncbi:Bgt-3025 [Blumeria graminis f. sp. tritici]|uniref:Bgt-3025 n=2 Tax=Blumeria graminis f. sp. tritici TaxID=62690 RepID=A0A9X9MN24_BLUGR|nr:hypothetical protein BGT96224_3025 [Blumeria graminis f. sp. tritici 96224]VDB93198.1 Bgt-3025 [Blumeria graminis f. sp. tritici]